MFENLCLARAQVNAKCSVKNEQGIFKIRLNEIIFIESKKKNTIIHTQHEQITSYKTMKEYEDRLREYRFYRCHISFIVNTDYVVNIQENELRMNNRKIIPISRYRRKELVQIIYNTRII
ncbi:LytR/AlgR family response regulator transcription factor [Paenibacillus lentus]|uniref:LytTR family transcriptional regulator n=1 Tax=Paenibacillus lentus TaxID=1338368 RepID=A0A3S8RQF2_9BACL|nr:LytTR family transcriptional regulator [Paenibacillus lentus]